MASSGRSRGKLSAGGRVRFVAGRARDPANGKFLSARQVAAREGAATRERAAQAAVRAERAPRGVPPGPPRRVAGGRIRIDERGRRRDPETGRFLGSRQVAAREAAATRQLSGRLRVPAGLPKGGQFLPRGAAGIEQYTRLQLASLQLQGELGAFVRVKIGGLKFRARAVEENIQRGIAGGAVFLAMKSGAGIAAGLERDRISEIVRDLENEGFDELDAYLDAVELGSLSIEPE